MAGSNVTEPQLNSAHVKGAKDETDLATVTAAIATQIKTYLDGTEGTHRQYNVKIEVIPMGV